MSPHPLLLFATALFSACAHGSSAQVCPEKGGDSWVRATSPHFELITDLDSGDASSLAGELEQIYLAFVDLAFQSNRPPTEQIRVVLFRDKDDFIDPKSKEASFAGFFTEDQIDQRPTLVITGDFDQATRELFQHELTHLFVRHHLAQAPRWLNEGLADFWETMTFEGGQAVIGKPMSCSRLLGRDALSELGGCHPSRWLSSGRLPAIETLVSASPERFYDEKNRVAYYGAAWALVHVLMTGTEIPRERFHAFQGEIAAGKEPSSAWNNLVAGADLKSLSDRVRGYFAKASIPLWRLDYQRKPAPRVSAVRLDADEVHLVHARWGARSKKDRALPEIQEALAHDPSSVDAHLMLAVHARTSSDAVTAELELDRALELAPEDARVLLTKLHWLMSSTSTSSWQSAAQVVERLEKHGKNAASFNSIAWYYAGRGDTDRGVPFAMRALQLEPGCWECFDTIALLAHIDGQNADAVKLQLRAISLIPDFRLPPKSVFERLKQYQRAAAEAPQR